MVSKWVFSLFILSVCGCEVDFGNGMKIIWLTMDGETHIDLKISNDIYTNYDWAGIGLKHYEDGYDMSHGDFNVVIFKGQKLEDKYAERNGAPTDDEYLGGEFSLIEGPVSLEDDLSRTFAWRRWVHTGDYYDTQIYNGGVYYWLWAYGMTTDGALNKHDDKGFMPFVMGDSCFAGSE